MKHILTPFKALITLGWLGVIILFMAGVIQFASFSQGSVPFDTEMEKMDALTILEGDVAYRLGSMQTSESFYVYAREYGLEAQEHLDDILAEDTAIDASLEEMTGLGYFAVVEEDYFNDSPGLDSYTPETLLREFNDLRAAHRQTFDQIIAAYDAQDPETAWALEEEAFDQNQAMGDKLKEVIDWIEQDRLIAASEFPSDAGVGIQWACFGFAAVIALALLGYQRISATTRPLRDLANVMTAIGGDQYRANLLGDLLKKGGPAGGLARALNELAQALQVRDAGMKNEVETQRQQLYESRRRRLKVFRADEKGGKL